MENVDTPTDHLMEQISDFLQDGFVEYSNKGTSVYQLIYYRECMDKYHHLHNWMTFIDLDEYIIIKDRCALPLRSLIPFGARDHT
jgi:hypothetical protein